MKIEELKAAASAATPGPWEVNGGDDVDTGSVSFWAGCPEDAQFIALANPSAILELIAAYEAAGKRIAELEAELEAEVTVALPGTFTSAEELFEAMGVADVPRLTAEQIDRFESALSDLGPATTLAAKWICALAKKAARMEER